MRQWQLAAVVQQTRWDARRCLRAAQGHGYAEQIAFHQARLAYLSAPAAEYGIPADLAAARATRSSVAAR